MTAEETACWHDVVPLSELWEGELHATEVNGVRIFLVKVAGAVRAYQDRCPHQLNPLSDGNLDQGTLTCKYHRWRFNLETGRGINPSSCSLFAVATRVQDGTIQVSPPDQVATSKA